MRHEDQGAVEWFRRKVPDLTSVGNFIRTGDAIPAPGNATLWAATLLRRAADRFVVLAMAPPPGEMDGAGGPNAEPA